MLGWLLYKKEDAETNKAYIDWFIHEGKNQDIDLLLIYREDLQFMIDKEERVILYKHQAIDLPDFVVVRTIEPIIQHMFESLSIPTFNSYQTAEIVNHKSWTYLEMQKLGIPLLKTAFIRKDAVAEDAPLPYPFVIKDAEGRSGKGVYYVESDVEWLKKSKIIESKDLIVQDANVSLGKDLRVFVIGKEIIAAVLRYNDRDFRANFTLGGKASLYSLSIKEKEMIQKIIQHFDFGLVGIDFLIDYKGQLIFNEIEDVVGSRILSATTEINLLERYVSFIKNKLNALKYDN